MQITSFPIFALASVVLAGCVNTKQFSSDILSTPSTLKSEQNFVIPGSSLTTSTDWDWLGFVALGVAAGSAAGSAQAGMSMATTIGGAQATNISSSSPFHHLKDVSVSSIFQPIGSAELGASFVPVSTAPSTRIEIVPSVNLLVEGGEVLFYQCELAVTYRVDDRVIWKRQYRNIAGSSPRSTAKPPPTQEEMVARSAPCLRDVARTFAKHISGELPRLYEQTGPRSGKVTYTEDRSQRGVYFARDGKDPVLYFVWPWGVEVIPIKYVESYTLN